MYVEGKDLFSAKFPNIVGLRFERKCTFGPRHYSFSARVFTCKLPCMHDHDDNMAGMAGSLIMYTVQ